MESIEKVLNSLKDRVPWHVMRKILHSHNLPTGQGWKPTIEKLLAYFVNSKDRQTEAAILFKTFREHILAGEKSLRLYEVGPNDIKQATLALVKVAPSKSIFSNEYPFPISNAALSEANEKPHLVEIVRSEYGATLVFCAKRYFTEKVPIKLKDLDISSEMLSDYDEIIGVRHTIKQMYDVVVLDTRSDYIEIRVDSSKHMSSDELEIAFNAIIDKLHSIMMHISSNYSLNLDKPVNLFQLVDSFYSSNEGRICELAFETDTASIKHEKMRRKAHDLRQEKYHKAGSAAVDHITPYRIGICWTINVTDNLKVQPELFLPGSVRMLSNPSLLLLDASIKNCSCLNDYEFVINKIKTHLQSNGQ